VIFSRGAWPYSSIVANVGRSEEFVSLGAEEPSFAHAGSSAAPDHQFTPRTIDVPSQRASFDACQLDKETT
jgi:hypothetical protein